MMDNWCHILLVTRRVHSYFWTMMNSHFFRICSFDTIRFRHHLHYHTFARKFCTKVLQESFAPKLYTIKVTRQPFIYIKRLPSDFYRIKIYFHEIISSTECVGFCITHRCSGLYTKCYTNIMLPRERYICIIPSEWDKPRGATIVIVLQFLRRPVAV